MPQYRLGRGSKGQEVRRLQRLLGIAQDGSFGPNTQEAVATYQRKHGLNPTGVADPTTLKMLGMEVFFGVDISGNNTIEDWDALCKVSSFIFVKATEGGDWKSPAYDKYLAAVATRSVPVRSCYHYAKMHHSAEVEAKHYLDTYLPGVAAGLLNGKPILDLEEEESGKSNEAILEWGKEWMHIVQEKTGQTPIFYTGKGFLEYTLKGGKGLTQYPLWLARYNGEDTPDPQYYGDWAEWTMWQYAVSWGVPGIDHHKVDHNWLVGGTLDTIKRSP